MSLKGTGSKANATTLMVTFILSSGMKWKGISKILQQFMLACHLGSGLTNANLSLKIGMGTRVSVTCLLGGTGQS